MSDRLEQATATADILREVARSVWAKLHDNDECPPAQIPTAADIQSYQADLSADVLDEVIARLTPILFWKQDGEDFQRDFARYLFPTLTELLHGNWQALDASDRPPHPLAPIVEAWQKRPKNKHQRSIKVTSPLRGDDRPLTRSPAIGRIAALPMDGEPFATEFPEAPRLQYKAHRVAKPQNEEQMLLWPAPRTIDRTQIDPIIATLDGYAVDDEVHRRTIRSDVQRIALLAYALDGPLKAQDAELAQWLTGTKPSQASIQRLWAALRFGDTTHVVLSDERWFPLLRAEIDGQGQSYLSAPKWWTDSDGEKAWRLSGGLYRPPSRGRRGIAGISYGAMHRTVDGLEAALTWGRASGKGRGGRIPDALKPVKKGGPGPEVFFPRDIVLTVSGERLNTDTDTAIGTRYNRTVQALTEAGYMIGDKGEAAHAGDTIEIVKRQRPSKGKEAGLFVRATARFCEAYHKGQNPKNWDSISAAHVLT